MTTRLVPETARARLVEFLEGLELDPDSEVRDDTPLIDSGILDSLAILQLAVWVEGAVGGPVDAGAVRLPEEWNTIERILAFVERHRDGGGRDG
jgi:acyl carrier protein